MTVRSFHIRVLLAASILVAAILGPNCCSAKSALLPPKSTPLLIPSKTYSLVLEKINSHSFQQIQNIRGGARSNNDNHNGQKSPASHKKKNKKQKAPSTEDDLPHHDNHDKLKEKPIKSHVTKKNKKSKGGLSSSIYSLMSSAFSNKKSHKDGSSSSTKAAIKKYTREQRLKILELQKYFTAFSTISVVVLRMILSNYLKNTYDFKTNVQHQSMAMQCFALYIIGTYLFHWLMKKLIQLKHDTTILILTESPFNFTNIMNLIKTLNSPQTQAGGGFPLATIMSTISTFTRKKQIPITYEEYDLQQNSKLKNGIFIELLWVLFSFGWRKDYTVLITIPFTGILNKLIHPLTLLHLLYFPSIGMYKRPFKTGFMNSLTLEEEEVDEKKTSPPQLPNMFSPFGGNPFAFPPPSTPLFPKMNTMNNIVKNVDNGKKDEKKNQKENKKDGDNKKENKKEEDKTIQQESKISSKPKKETILVQDYVQIETIPGGQQTTISKETIEIETKAMNDTVDMDEVPSPMDDIADEEEDGGNVIVDENTINSEFNNVVLEDIPPVEPVSEQVTTPESESSATETVELRDAVPTDAELEITEEDTLPSKEDSFAVETENIPKSVEEESAVDSQESVDAEDDNIQIQSEPTEQEVPVDDKSDENVDESEYDQDNSELEDENGEESFDEDTYGDEEEVGNNVEDNQTDENPVDNADQVGEDVEEYGDEDYVADDSEELEGADIDTNEGNEGEDSLSEADEQLYDENPPSTEFTDEELDRVEKELCEEVGEEDGVTDVDGEQESVEDNNVEDQEEFEDAGDENSEETFEDDVAEGAEGSDEYSDENVEDYEEEDDQ